MSIFLLVLNWSFLQSKTVYVKVIGNLLNNPRQKDKGDDDDSHKESPEYIYLTLLQIQHLQNPHNSGCHDQRNYLFIEKFQLHLSYVNCTLVTQQIIILQAIRAIRSPKLNKIMPTFLLKKPNFIHVQVKPIITKRLKVSFNELKVLVLMSTLVNSKAVREAIKKAKK